MSDLEALAAAGRAKRDAPKHPSKEEPPAGPPTDPERVRRARRAVLNAEGQVRWMLGSFGVFAAGAAGLAYGIGKDVWAGPLAGVALFASVLVHFFVVAPWLFARERARFEALPYPFSFGRYLHALGKARDTTRIKVEVTFEGDIPASDRRLLEDAGNGMHADARADVGDSLTLRATYAPSATTRATTTPIATKTSASIASFARSC